MQREDLWKEESRVRVVRGYIHREGGRGPQLLGGSEGGESSGAGGWEPVSHHWS